MYSDICLSFVFLITFNPKANPTICIVDKGMLPIVKNSLGLRFYVDIENDNRKTACNIYARPRKCCIKDMDIEDCDVFKLYGGARECIEPKDRTTLVYVLPVVHQYGLVGYCEVFLNYYCLKKRANLRIIIPFDTRLQKTTDILLENYSDLKRSNCENKDLDPLNDCLPVDCDQKYLGLRPFFDESMNKCIETPVCIGDVNDMASVVYLPHINVCRDLNTPLSIQDIYVMSTGLGTIEAPIKSGHDVNVEIKSNCSTISQNLYFLRDLMYGKFCPCLKNVNLDFSNCCKAAVLSIVMCIFSICALLLLFVCCGNVFVWMYKRTSKREFKECIKRAKNRFKRKKPVRSKQSRIDTEVRNALLREVLVKDIPLELRDSVISFCNRMENEVRKKKIYRKMDTDSQISLQKEPENDNTSSSPTSAKSCKDCRVK